MNVKNNKRRQASKEKIESAFIELLQTRELSQITVAEICKITDLNRSTFYANYLDVYDLADKLRDTLEAQVEGLYTQDGGDKYAQDDWLKLFNHIYDNQIFYKTYFKLGYDSTHSVNVSALSESYKIFPEKYMHYHIEFFKNGFNAIVKMWLNGGCKETPEEMSEILKREYLGRTK